MPDLQETVQFADALRQTSLATGKLLATAALSDAATTLDGREAITLLRHLTEATFLAAIRTADTISDLAHGNTAPASASLDRAAAHLAGTPQQSTASAKHSSDTKATSTPRTMLPGTTSAQPSPRPRSARPSAERSPPWPGATPSFVMRTAAGR
ncbi:hypothetical protein Slala04_02190 [Streptomyces lavendulae subsp. lavendulae]|nr:hypothetical protein Slala04_02190 [Streptomyces lavendulae subsp. lavendulae]